ncbi:MAG: carbon storage regulator [Blautia sp.]|nr:carbon storage regulator [Blautia sp.]
MLKLSLHPGEYINIGDDIRVVLAGGIGNNIQLLVDAPKEIPIARSSMGDGRKKPTGYYRDAALSEEAQQQIVEIIMREKRRGK